MATKSIQKNEYKFYIQCKFFNTTVDKHPIQEVFAGANYYAESSGKGIPVVITNNRVTREARLYAKRLGVEIIADAEWAEFRQIYQDKQVVNPNTHHGLFGIIIATIPMTGLQTTGAFITRGFYQPSTPMARTIWVV